MPDRTSRATSTRSAERRASRLAGETGSGLLSSVVGVTVFLVLLLFAVQLALNLYATSAVSAVAYDAARMVAGSDGGPTATDRAEAHARQVLSRYEERDGKLEFAWDVTRDDAVVLTVRAHRKPLLPNVSFPFQDIERTIRVRWERVR